MSRAPSFMAVSLIALLTTGAAFAHPHEKADKKETVEKSWPYFGGSSDDDDDSMTVDEFTKKLESRFSKHSEKLKQSMDKVDKKVTVRKFKFDGDEPADDIREAGRMIEEALTDSGMISSLTEMLADLTEDFDVEEGGDGTKVFMFDGKKMGHFKMDRDREEKGRMNIGGLGQNLSIERETYVKDGKTKTRIVIEMDGGEDIDIDLPELEGDSKKKIRIRKEIEKN